MSCVFFLMEQRKIGLNNNLHTKEEKIMFIWGVLVTSTLEPKNKGRIA